MTRIDLDAEERQLEVQRRVARMFEGLPPSTKLTAKQASLYSGFALQTLAQWRHEKTGPRHSGARPITYTIAALDEFAASRSQGRSSADEAKTRRARGVGRALAGASP